MLFILGVIYTIIDYIYQILFNEQFNISEYIKRLFILNRYILNWTIKSNELNYIDKNSERILVLFTHPKITDGIFALKYLTSEYPNHKVVFVVKKELVDMFLLGDYFKNNFICLEKDYSKDETYIVETLTKIMEEHEKIVIGMFPEGTTYCFETVEKSNKWCDNNNIPRFRRLLCPRTRGFELIKNLFNPTQMLNNIIYYEDDINHNKTNYEIDLLKFDIVHKCNIISESIVEDDIYKVWRRNDKLLDKIYTYQSNDSKYTTI
jgi:1-acyl-sn-glycerol-3-phosphate acyltransferase